MNLKFKTFILFLILIVLVGCSATINARFVFEKTPQGVALYENKQPVFFYQKEPKTPDGVNYFNNYLHPLFSLEGDTLTEEFPSDHPYHRGIFWAWHQLYINNESVGDGWIMDNISQDVVDLKTKVNKSSAQLSLSVLWKSSLFQHDQPFVREHTTIIVHQLKSGIRAIDFEIDLRALVPGVSIGGANDEKGYGGFCARIKLPDNLCFTSERGQVVPQTLQIKAGPWMDFSAPFGKQGELNGLTVLCHPSTPNYPGSWILRNKSSMQNIVFPGKIRTELSVDKSTVLHYRVIVHNGSSKDMDILKIKAEYEKMGVK
ncbi:MAG: PmoA family protein [Bacteroidetes bacterium]|nr:PmoA family protein [Bacteroidota bacterium]